MKNPFFITYNPQLKKFLDNKNIHHGVCGVNPNNNKTFWVYDRTNEDFSNALDEWIANKPNK